LTADDDEGFEIIAVPFPVPEALTTFSLTRERTSSIRGTRQYFTFFLEGGLLFRAKAKGKNPSEAVVITTKSEVHLRGGGEFFLIAQNDSTFFSLRQHSPAGTELMTVTIRKTGALLTAPPHSAVRLLPAIGCAPLALESKRPTLTVRREWKLDFGRRFVVPSEKNAIFVIPDEPAQREFLVMRKIGSASFEIDIADRIPRVAGFAVALSLCLARFTS
jgi:hypothetical protein